MLASGLVFAQAPEQASPNSSPSTPPAAALSSKPQTARQALIEFLFSGDHERVARHYPEVAKKAFHRIKDDLGELTLSDFFGITGDLRNAAKRTQTFDEGPVLATLKDSDGQVTDELDVEADEERPQEERFELTYSSYKSGKPDFMPGIFRVTVVMRLEKKVWRTAEMKMSLAIPLDNPDFLKTQVAAAKEKRKDDNAGAALMTVRQIVAAESAFAEAQPKLGYTCALPDLVTASAEQENLRMSPDLASGKFSGYVFKLRGCGTPPANNFQVTAEPEGKDDGTISYCSDESGTLRFLDDGSGAECLSSGENVDKPIQAPSPGEVQ